MKFDTSSKIFVSSNLSFSPAARQGRSYNWTFVCRERHGVIFNDAKWSITTSKHQNKMRELLRQLKIPILLELRFTKLDLVEDKVYCLENEKRKTLWAIRENREYLKLRGIRKTTKITVLAKIKELQAHSRKLDRYIKKFSEVEK